MPQAHPRSRHRQMTLLDHLYLVPNDDRREISRTGYPCHINHRARVEWKDWQLWNRDEDSAGRVVNEQGCVARLDVEVIVGHHRPQVDGVLSPRLGGGKTVRLPRSGEQPQVPRLGLRDLSAV